MQAGQEINVPVAASTVHNDPVASVCTPALSHAIVLQELKDLVKRLLTHSPSQRLGSLKGGALDVKAHPWFKDFDWESFEKQTMPAPYIPKVMFVHMHNCAVCPCELKVMCLQVQHSGTGQPLQLCCCCSLPIITKRLQCLAVTNHIS